jgi:2-(1,2-epoxy-1,2-dihydrophenyl)acetyl-CoA isomerase
MRTEEPRLLDTGSDDLLARIENNVLVVSLNRPAQRNALSRAILNGLAALFRRAARDSDVRALLMTGVGGSFCAGADIGVMNERHIAAQPPPSFEGSVDALRADQDGVIAALFELPKPTIAAIGGAVAGGGVGLALACDFRIAAPGAFLTTAFAKLGFSGDYGGSWLLTQLVGAARARELYYLSERIDAPTCERLGVFCRVVSAETLDDEARALAERLARGPTIAYRYMKENLNRAMNADFRTALDAEAYGMGRCSQTEDHREAVKAFIEKRAPVFNGR